MNVFFAKTLPGLSVGEDFGDPSLCRSDNLIHSHGDRRTDRWTDRHVDRGYYSTLHSYAMLTRCEKKLKIVPTSTTNPLTLKSSTYSLF